MKESGNGRQTGTAGTVHSIATRARARRESTGGIEVQEEELGSITAQRLYKMRCGCGRSWFELQLPNLATCPACSKMGLVSS